MADKPPGAAGSGAKYPQWVVNTATWTVGEVANPAAKALAIAATWPDKLVFFTSQSAAEQWVKSQGHTPVSLPGMKQAQGAVNVGGALVGGAPDLLTALKGIWAGLSDGKMWRSLGWIVLGVVLMLLGAAAWIGMSKNPLSIARRAAG